MTKKSDVSPANNQTVIQLDGTEAITELQAEVAALKERERRALADYQNVLKRSQEERIKTIAFANRELLSALLEPVEHLSLAAEQIKDKGLNMVVGQFWQVLNRAGLTEIKTDGVPFDPMSMEAVQVGEHKEKVVKCLKKGYQYHDQTLQPAKVVLD